MAGSAGKLELIRPDWPAAPRIAAAATTRAGGHSIGSFTGLNLAEHVGEEPERVARNRRILAAELDLPEAPRWLKQVHGEQVVDAAEVSVPTTADAIISATPGQVCAVLTADCLPVLLCDRQARHVAAIHAGWRGFCWRGSSRPASRRSNGGRCQPAAYWPGSVRPSGRPRTRLAITSGNSVRCGIPIACLRLNRVDRSTGRWICTQ